MAIVKMSKFNLFAFEDDVAPLLDELQRFEYVHFVDTQDLSEENDLERVEIPEPIAHNQEEITKLTWMIDLLSSRIEKPGGLKAMKKGLDNYTLERLEKEAEHIEYDPLYTKLKDITQELDKITAEKNNLLQQIADLKPWNGLTSKVSELKDTERLVIMSGTIQSKGFEAVKEEFLDLNYSYLQEVFTEKNVVYLVAVTLREDYNSAIEILRKHGFNKVDLLGNNTPVAEIEDRKKRIEELDEERKALEERLDHYTEHLKKLELLYEYKRNQKLKLTATQNFMKLSDVHITQGYIPTEMSEKFTKTLDRTLGNKYFVELTDADKDDETVPILLENGKFVGSFESITSMYALPKYNEVDPTPFFAIFYWVFFGMMAADFAYGALVFVATAIVLKSFNLNPKMRKFVAFFFFLSISVMIWGLIYGSAFGMPMPKPFGIIDTNNDAIKLLGMSIVFGGIHLFYAMGIQAYIKIRDGKPIDAVYDVLFWYMALMGAIVFMVSKMVPGFSPVAGVIAMWVMILGMVGIVLFSARDAEKPAGRIIGGLYNLYGISSYVGDFVSYSRLMALGLAGGFIAVAINMIVQMLGGNMVGMLFGAVIFLGGHAFNAFLSLLSAYVHTSRLTYVEFFGKFYEGGGKAFNLFRNDSKYINIK